MVKARQCSGLIAALALLPLLIPAGNENGATARPSFTFVVTSDVRSYAGPGAYNAPQYFRGAVEAIDARGGGAFMVSVGDIDPPAGVLWTITSTLGTDFLWYPVVGNHELPGDGSEAYHGANMDWLRSYDYDPNGAGTQPDVVNAGPNACPETTYSFDYDNTHLVVLNEYCDEAGDAVRDGDVPDYLYNWLAADLAATDRTHILVFGHECAYPQPDADSGRSRHVGDSLDQYPANRDRFWTLLKDEGVVAYICAHTHNYSAVQIEGLWQLDTGHARGAGDTGAPSTFLIFHVDGSAVWFEAYRDGHDDVGDYDYDEFRHAGVLALYRLFLPLISKT